MGGFGPMQVWGQRGSVSGSGGGGDKVPHAGRWVGGDGGGRARSRSIVLVVGHAKLMDARCLNCRRGGGGEWGVPYAMALCADHQGQWGRSVGVTGWGGGVALLLGNQINNGRPVIQIIQSIKVHQGDVKEVQVGRFQTNQDVDVDEDQAHKGRQSRLHG
ncbi:hypothetical protein Tco_1123572 [Tanacetum coccineum]|uniref:Uncharacterized protein n=1 Tax=Tanacetum coccineum TaxID=301880 RepID=A0ABQ5J6J4_9ASTR